MAPDLFFEIGIVLIVATLFAIFARLLKQPLILGYMLAGIAIGPIGLGFIRNTETIQLLSELGVAFLLFVVGLQLDIKKIRNLGTVSLVAGLGQMLFTFAIGYIMLTYFGVIGFPAIILSLALTLSSTVIIIKLLSDKNEIDTLHGRVALGILLVQDLLAVIALSLVSAQSFTIGALGWTALKGLALLGGTIALSAFLAPLFRFLASSRELLLIGALTTCFSMAIVSRSLGFSIAIGAFLAGVALAALPYSGLIAARAKPLRDFFATIFFVAIGLQIMLPRSAAELELVFAASAFVLIGNPLILLVLMSLLGMSPRAAFITGLSIAQISEFSLILVMLARDNGLLNNAHVSIIAMVALITFGFSTYLITYSESIALFLTPLIRPFRHLSLRSHELGYTPPPGYKADILLCGADRIGRGVLEAAKQMKQRILAVDFNPVIVRGLTEARIPCIYGDIADPEIMDQLVKVKPKTIVITDPTKEDNLLLIKTFKPRKAKVIATAFTAKDALEFYNAGADYVIVPHLLGAERARDVLCQTHAEWRALLRAKKDHLRELAIRAQSLKPPKTGQG